MLKFREINLDHGTPKRESEEIVSLKIDGFETINFIQQNIKKFCLRIYKSFQ